MNYLKIWRNFFKLNERYSVIYATTDRDTSKLLNIIEIHVFFSYIIWLFSIFNSANGYIRYYYRRDATKSSSKGRQNEKTIANLQG